MNRNFKPYLKMIIDRLTNVISCELQDRWYDDIDSMWFGWSDRWNCWYVSKYDHSDYGSLMLLGPKDLISALKEAWCRLGYDTHKNAKEVDWNDGGFSLYL